MDINNPFSTTLIIRTLGFLLEKDLIDLKTVPDPTTDFTKVWKLNETGADALTIKQIAQELTSDLEQFKVKHFPPSSAIIYWFVDGIRRCNIPLAPTAWTQLCKWSAYEFNHQLSLVIANHDALMDPFAMAMAACLCSRLRQLSHQNGYGPESEDLSKLPSDLELENSIIKLFSLQNQSGIWNKYFPMFHYKDDKAGSNYCFTYELLEAILCEFGCGSFKLLEKQSFLEGLERAITWCENNRLQCSLPPKRFHGWNSGGQLHSLRDGYPESWATAVVHMFLFELVSATSHYIQVELLGRYGSEEVPNSVNPSKSLSTGVNRKLLDIAVYIQKKETSLQTLLHKHFINHPAEDEKSIRLNGISKARSLSALLFGPPGTSKTEVVKAVAEELGWPLLELTPSNFVRETLANVYTQTDRIFQDLMDLAGVVVFFDEMDALVQTRDGKEHLDLTSQFLTTTMLPKLARLHAKRNVMFFMATNYQERFDPAIKRAGRFDLLLCMGPPTYEEKLNRLHDVYSTDDAAAAEDAARQLSNYLDKAIDLKEQFELLTFGEYKSFLKNIPGTGSLADRLRRLTNDTFRQYFEAKASEVTLRRSDLELLKKALRESTLVGLRKKKFNLSDVYKADGTAPDVVRYLYDWHHSREQV